MRSSLICALAVALLVTGAGARAQVVDRILAVVDDRPMLLSEVRLAQSVNGVSLAEALEATIDEHLMFAQAARLSQTAATPEQEEAAFQSLIERFEGAPGPPDATPNANASNDTAALRAMARRQVTILKYVDFRFRPLVRIDPVTSASPADSPADDPAEGTAGSADERQRQRAAAESLDARLEQWVAELRASAEIRYTDAEP